VSDWDVNGTEDPCDPDCHIPEDALLEKNEIVKDHLHPEFRRIFANFKPVNPYFRRYVAEDWMD
jgi:hypothetical protein